MRMSRILKTCSAVLLIGSNIMTTAFADISLEKDLEFPSTSEWKIQNAEYTIFAKPPKGWVGDVMPLAGDEESGALRLFYLQDWRDGAPTYHPFHSFVTTDFVHYNYLGEAIPTTNIEDYDLALGTGSVTKIGNTYHAFYTGNNPRWFSQGKNREYIRHAVSLDGENFVKLEEETFTSSQTDGYDKENFRDPFLFWNEEKQEYWLLITSVRNGKAVIARYRSVDLSNWEQMEPFLTPGTSNCECPDLFQWGEWWYCFFSTDWVTRYVRARSLDGPWETPPMPTFDSHAFYAAKTGVLNGKRYLCGWIGTRGGYSGEFKDSSEWDWAGNLAVFQLEQDDQGWLTIHLPDTIREAFNDPVSLVGSERNAIAIVSENNIVITADRDGGGIAFSALPDKPVLISTDVSVSDKSRAAGFFFGNSQIERALAVELDMKSGLLRYDASLVSRARYSAEKSYISREIDTTDRQYHMDILIDNDVAVFFLDNREALSVRIYRMPEMPWGIYVSDGSATFQRLTLRVLND